MRPPLVHQGSGGLPGSDLQPPLEFKKFIPDNGLIETIGTDPGVLLPSSTNLRSLIGEPLRWKVRLSKAPTQNLDYFFMRSSFDPEEIAARHNIDSRVQTPREATFGGHIGVELTVKEDGTAEPTFIYGRGTQGKNTVVRGRPFYMDMTYAVQDAGGETYLGFDFGTSTSSLCYVDGNDIRIYADRATDRTWLGLSALIDVLPYPAAYPLARFLSETSVDQMDRWGREAFEGMLTTAAYVAYAEHCSLGGEKGSVFKSFRQRSAGPLWAMFRKCAASTGAKWVFAKELTELSAGSLFDELDQAVSKVALSKHGKKAEGLDYPRLLERMGNVLARAFSGKVFGYFEDAKRKPFSMNRFQGVFRNARGSSPPFIDVYEYEGPEDFPSEFVFVFDVEQGKGLPLFPMITRGLDRNRSHHDEPDFYVYDIARAENREIAFRAIQEREEVVLDANDNFPDLFRIVAEVLKTDQPFSVVEGIELKPRSRNE
jgi:hypothetical protein